MKSIESKKKRCRTQSSTPRQLTEIIFHYTTKKWKTEMINVFIIFGRCLVLPTNHRPTSAADGRTMFVRWMRGGLLLDRKVLGTSFQRGRPWERGYNMVNSPLNSTPAKRNERALGTRMGSFRHFAATENIFINYSRPASLIHGGSGRSKRLTLPCTACRLLVDNSFAEQ